VSDGEEDGDDPCAPSRTSDPRTSPHKHAFTQPVLAPHTYTL
jgi:hypothetical protein